ncbi:hypothetical protein ACH5RR_041444, partial [Cinchona calisaya]
MALVVLALTVGEVDEVAIGRATQCSFTFCCSRLVCSMIKGNVAEVDCSIVKVGEYRSLEAM